MLKITEYLFAGQQNVMVLQQNTAVQQSSGMMCLVLPLLMKSKIFMHICETQKTGMGINNLISIYFTAFDNEGDMSPRKYVLFILESCT